MTILAPTPTPQHTVSLLTGFDVLDIRQALQNAAANDTTTLNAADRQALALLTYDRTVCKAMPAWLIENILDGLWPLPVDEARAKLLLRLVDRLPDVPRDVHDQWLAARERSNTADAVDRGLWLVACEAARHPGSIRATSLRWGVAAIHAERLHGSSTAIPDDVRVEAHRWACALVERARKNMLAAEYGEIPAAATR